METYLCHIHTRLNGNAPGRKMQVGGSNLGRWMPAAAPLPYWPD